MIPLTEELKKKILYGINPKVKSQLKNVYYYQYKINENNKQLYIIISKDKLNPSISIRATNDMSAISKSKKEIRKTLLLKQLITNNLEYHVSTTFDMSLTLSKKEKRLIRRAGKTKKQSNFQ